MNKKIMISAVAIFFILFVSLFYVENGMDSDNTAPVEPEETLEEQIKIEFGQTIQFEDLELYFYDIEDSRCPLDVTCVWEGKVTVMIKIKNQTHNIEGIFTPGYTISNFTPYEITLVDILPHPITTQDSEYVATLSISKMD